MTGKKFYYGALALGALATITLAVTLTFSISRFYRRSTPPVNLPLVAQATRSTAAESSGGPKEGIKVHGHWTIEVRNPDGTLVTHREFENALVADGAKSLAMSLGYQKVLGEWSLSLAGDPLDESACWNSPPPNISRQPAPCLITQSNSSQGSTSGTFLNLTVDVPNSGANANRLVLSGNATARRDGRINRVTAYNYRCDPAVAAQNCFSPGDNSGAHDFTSTYLLDPSGQPAPLQIAEGRIVQVTVVISFS